MSTREQWELRRKQFEAFNRWEAEQPPIERDPADIIADLGTLVEWLRAEERLCATDLEKIIGIQKMRAALALIKPRR